MRPKYKIGETVFFTIVADDAKETQTFGVIRAITIQLTDEPETHITYMFSDLRSCGESAIQGKAVIQLPRTRKRKPKEDAVPAEAPTVES